MGRWVILVAPVLAGCAGSQAALEGRLKGLETQIRDLERSAAAQRQQVTSLENRLMLLQDQVETRQMAAGRAAAAAIGASPAGSSGVGAGVPGPSLEVPRALPSVRLVPREEEAVEEGDEESGDWESGPSPGSRDGRQAAVRRPDEMDDAYATLTDDGRVVSSRTRARPAPSRGPRTEAPRGGDPAPEVGEDRVLTAYREAYEAYQQGRLDEAMAAFRDFLRRHPKHPYADNAQYWIGECHYDRKEWAQARQEFLRVVTDHPDGNKVPDAMVKVGLCDQRLEQWDEARRMYDAVMLTYPESPAAAVAVRLLGELP